MPYAVTPVVAQSASLAISPPVIEILLAPNKKIVHAFKLTNQGESSDFVANIHTLTPSDSNGHSIIDPTPLDPSTIPLTISLANADRELGQPFHLDSNDSTQLVLEIEGANTDITIDSYLALVITPIIPSSQPPKADPPWADTLPSISALILTTLSPDGIIPINLKVTDFNIPSIHDSTTPLTISAKLTNSSNIMLRPQSTLIISKPQQSNSDEITLDPNLILANSSRTLTVNSSPPIYHPKWYYIGPYEFTLKVTTEGNSQITSITKTVWLLPIRAIITLALLALFITYLLLLTKKHRSTGSPTH